MARGHAQTPMDFKDETLDVRHPLRQIALMYNVERVVRERQAVQEVHDLCVWRKEEKRDMIRTSWLDLGAWGRWDGPKDAFGGAKLRVGNQTIQKRRLEDG